MAYNPDLICCRLSLRPGLPAPGIAPGWMKMVTALNYYSILIPLGMVCGVTIGFCSTGQIRCLQVQGLIDGSMQNVGYIDEWVSSVLVGAGLPGSCCYSVAITEASNQSDKDSRYKVTAILNVHTPDVVAGQAMAVLQRLQADWIVNAQL